MSVTISDTRVLFAAGPTPVVGGWSLPDRRVLCEDVAYAGGTASYSGVQVNATLPYSLIDVFVQRGRCAG